MGGDAAGVSQGRRSAVSGFGQEPAKSNPQSRDPTPTTQPQGVRRGAVGGTNWTEVAKAALSTPPDDSMEEDILDIIGWVVVIIIHIIHELEVRMRSSHYVGAEHTDLSRQPGLGAGGL